MNLAYRTDRSALQQVDLCYHCHKCTAGCPVLPAMQYGPDQVFRLVKLNQWDALLSSRDIWLCAACYTCATRCPNGLEIVAIMDALRRMAISRNYQAGERDILLFHRLFLAVIRRLGRSHEAFMLGLFKVLSHVPLMNDMGSGIGLFKRGKVPLLPRQTRSAKEVREIFRKGA
jgi:heterodisulfide reductase subunit C